MTRPNCPSSFGRKRHHHVPYVPSTTACTKINTFITSVKGLSGPAEQQERISIGMCPCLLIPVPIIYARASRCTHEHSKALFKDIHMLPVLWLTEPGLPAASLAADKTLNCLKFENKIDVERRGSCHSTSPPPRSSSEHQMQKDGDRTSSALNVKVNTVSSPA